MAEDMLKSAVIEEKKFNKHSPWAGTDNPMGPKFWCQHEGLITMVICCVWKESLQPLTLYTSFHDLINVYSCRSGADNPRGQNFDVNRNSCHFGHLLQVSKNLFEVWFYTFFFIIFYMHIAPGQGLTTRWGWNFDVNKNILSLPSFVASLKKISLKSDFIHFFFMILYMYIAPGQGQTAPRGQSFDFNRNVLSLHSFVASFKKMSLKSVFIQFFSWFNTCI